MADSQSTAADAAYAEQVAQNQAERVCHKEQLQIWADEMLAELGEFLAEDMSYDKCVQLNHALMTEIKRIVACAFGGAAKSIYRLPTSHDERNLLAPDNRR